MSRRNHKNRTATGTENRHLHAVADDPGQQDTQTTEDKVRAALATTPDSTTAALATAAGVGRSTAAKILARWGRDGTAIRTAGDGPRNPDTWTLAPSNRDAAAPDTEDAQLDTTATPSTDSPTENTSDTDDDTTQDPVDAEDALTGLDNATAEDTAAVHEVTAGSDATASEPDGTATDTADEAATSSNIDPETDDTTQPPETALVDPADSVAENETEPSPAEPPAVTDTDTSRADKDRLPKGGLRALVEEYLTNHAGKSFGPAEIGKDLSRSGGAVNNALEKLVTDGYAIKTCEAPKRFSINPDKTDVPRMAKDAAEPALES
ncbi:hypothetical protein [Amycolatopsis sp. 195334CR]|uniref:hypothetical protein n=1 Tax=Amycolatopsis sp. 195334CR TaxID=2814588 RepID=UPI001A8CA37C|nr:hypothetical protein [Amycolatopsis sp. 195334CR]MBN6034135.1 hypothetical protein [Amycolatopsis sp. 195334CR]